jgi:CP family cyanate transporter-like MFS transporter
MGSQDLQINKTASTAVKTGSAALILGIVFLAANMRAPLTSVGPLVGDIRGTLSISNMAAGILTTLPLLAFALLSPFAPKLSRRFGMEKVLFTALALLTLGIVIRSAAGVASLFAGTALIGIAISVCNVLLPGLIKQEFPQRIGVVTGTYSVAMNLCGAVASGISIPLTESLGLGWKGALGCWGILAIVAMAAWIPQLKGRHMPAVAVASAGTKRSSIWKSPLAWQVTLFMGMQSFVFYVTVAWLPEILASKGMDAGTAGWMLFLMQFALLPFTFIVPILAAKMNNQRPLVVITGVLFVSGIAGFLFDAPLVALWTVLLGIGAGFAFSLAMMFFGLRTQTTSEAAELSGMAQSIGYLLAAVGPTLFGLLHDMTHGWKIPLMLLLAASVLLFLVGMGAAKNRYVNS